MSSEFPPAMTKHSYCSTLSSTFGIVRVLDFHHSIRCAVVSHSSFNLPLYDDIGCGAATLRLIFHILLCEISVIRSLGL